MRILQGSGQESKPPTTNEMTKQELTDEELNRAICEWRNLCVVEKERNEHRIVWLIKSPDEEPIGEFGGPLTWTPTLADAKAFLPNHTTAPEALGNMHEAEKRLATEEQQYLYLCALESIAWEEESAERPRSLSCWPVHCATARQRAIALLHVVKPELFQ